VVGSDGDRYAIRIRNHDGQRVEVVATVDGLDVIDGTRAGFSKRGYIVDPYATLLIEGFRRSSSAIAAFRFGAVADSYAARTQSDRHVGVIGVAVFGERARAPEYSEDELRRRDSADPFPGRYARPPQR
jgi:urate oxidase